MNIITDNSLQRFHDNLNDSISYRVNTSLPIGSLIPFAGINIPESFLLCDGRAVSRTVYKDLFEALGTTYGAGDGSTTFNLPDMRSYIPIGSDSRDSNINSVGKKYGGLQA